MKSDLTIRYGLIFGKPTYAVAGMSALASIPMFAYSDEHFYLLYLGVFSLLLAFFIITITIGKEFDIENKKFRNYKSYLGIKTGNWKTYEHFESIIIISYRFSKTYSIKAAIPSTYNHYSHGVYLTNRSHLGRIFMNDFETRKQAEIFAENIAKQLDLKIEEYSPKKISVR